MAVLILGIVLLLVVLAAYFAYRLHFPDNYKKMKKFPSPSPKLPIIGNIMPINNIEVTDILYKSHSAVGSPYMMKLGPKYWVMIACAELTEALLRGTNNMKKGKSYDVFTPWFGDGLLTTSGQKWHRHRKMLTPTFHFKILNGFHPIMNEQSQIMVDIIKEALLSNNQQPIDMCPLLTKCTLDVILETSMGHQLNTQRQPLNSYVRSIYEYIECSNYQVSRPWLWNEDVFALLSSLGRRKKRALKILHSFTGRVIDERKRAFDEGEIDLNTDTEDDKPTLGKKRLAFLDLLLDMQRNGQLTATEVREEVDTFLFEGHDTTACGLMFAVYCLGRHPEYQKKCQEELDSILGASTCPTVENLTKMKYLEYCIKESQRIYPSVPYIERMVEKAIHVDGYPEIPVGVTVGMNIHRLHHDEKHFPEPMRYDPERFRPENVAGRHPYAFTPFSAGPRNCIGQKYALMEEKTVLCHLLRNFDLQAVDDEASMVLEYGGVLRPTNGVWTRVCPRTHHLENSQQSAS